MRDIIDRILMPLQPFLSAPWTLSVFDNRRGWRVINIGLVAKKRGKTVIEQAENQE